MLNYITLTDRTGFPTCEMDWQSVFHHFRLTDYICCFSEIATRYWRTGLDIRRFFKEAERVYDTIYRHGTNLVGQFCCYVRFRRNVDLHSDHSWRIITDLHASWKVVLDDSMFGGWVRPCSTNSTKLFSGRLVRTWTIWPTIKSENHWKRWNADQTIYFSNDDKGLFFSTVDNQW